MKASMFAAMQYLLPKYLLTRLVYRVARIRNLRVKNWLIHRFIKAFDVDISEVKLSVPDDFPTFNDFFVRELHQDARPIAEGAGVLVTPADGILSQFGAIQENTLVQAKGLDYSARDLLAVDVDKADNYASFACIYLAPYNYHRVHAPIAGTLTALHYIPGDLFSVNAMTAKKVPSLFVRNERLNFHFETKHGPIMLSMVGALNVGSITTPWTGEIRPSRSGGVTDFRIEPQDVSKGDLLGWFNMGSTVVMLLPPCEWDAALRKGATVRLGTAFATT